MPSTRLLYKFSIFLLSSVLNFDCAFCMRMEWIGYPSRPANQETPPLQASFIDEVEPEQMDGPEDEQRAQFRDFVLGLARHLFYTKIKEDPSLERIERVNSTLSSETIGETMAALLTGGNNESFATDIFNNAFREDAYSRHKKKFFAYAGLGLLAGITITPVQLSHASLLMEKMGVNVYGNEWASEIIRYATMVILASTNIVEMGGIALNEKSSISARYASLGNALTATTGFLPILMLYNVERLHAEYNPELADLYYTVFGVGFFPLLFTEFLTMKESVFRLSQQCDLSWKKSLVTSALPMITTLSRGLAGYAIASQAMETSGFSGPENTVISVVFGSIAAIGTNFLGEVGAMRSLAINSSSEENVGNLMNSIRSKAYGAIKKLPIICISVYKSIPYAAAILSLTSVPTNLQWIALGGYVLIESGRYIENISHGYERMACIFKRQ